VLHIVAFERRHPPWQSKAVACASLQLWVGAAGFMAKMRRAERWWSRACRRETIPVGTLRTSVRVLV
jgi:hypothetical protein